MFSSDRIQERNLPSLPSFFLLLRLLLFLLVRRCRRRCRFSLEKYYPDSIMPRQTHMGNREEDRSYTYERNITSSFPFVDNIHA